MLLTGFRERYMTKIIEPGIQVMWIAGEHNNTTIVDINFRLSYNSINVNAQQNIFFFEHKNKRNRFLEFFDFLALNTIKYPDCLITSQFILSF